MSFEDWIHCGYPHHFIGSSDCRFSLTTFVAGGLYLVSTVGDYRPYDDESRVQSIGLDGETFETMVFLCDPMRPDEYGEPTVVDWSELYMQRYTTHSDANRGHFEACGMFDKLRGGSHQLEHSSEIVHNVHSVDLCEGEFCTIHNMSDHHMRAWPQHWRHDRRIMERICPHGVGHPDPDERSWINTIHGCDGCCNPPHG